MWRGNIAVGQATVPVAVCGSRRGPLPAAVSLGKSIADQYPAWQAQIENALIDHLMPYAEAVSAGDLPPPEQPLPAIEKPSEIWQHVVPTFVAIAPISGNLCIEFGYQVSWEDEHTLGAQVGNGRLLALCGSVLPP